MLKFLNKLEPTDLIAMILISGCLILKWHGADGYVSMTVTMIVGYYFGKKGNFITK
jgi:hypothetical protein